MFHRSTRSIVVLASLSLVAACSAARHDFDEGEAPSGAPVATDQAIVHGALDRGKHPAVVALVMETDQGSALCSGTLVAPDVILTARHCVSQLASESVDCPSNSVQVGKNYEASSIGVITSAAAKGATPIAHGDAIYTLSTKVLCDADIALLHIDTKIAGIAPLAVEEDASAALPSTVTSVGYGLTSTNGTYGTREYRSAVKIRSSTSTEFVVGESTCSGDSGGPALDEETGMIVGVVSRGSQDCSGTGAENIYTRVAHSADLVKKVLAKYGAAPAAPSGSKGTSDMGDGCTSGSTCSSGVCVTPDDYCSRSCGPNDGRCPAGYHCARTKDETVGACAKAN